jgi:PAS domain S-box-containing protein
MLDDSAIDEPDYLDALGDCCRDPAAFTKLKQILVDLQKRQNHLAASLHESEARNLALLNAIPDLMFRIHRDGTYLECRANQETDLAIPISKTIGKKVRDVLPSDVAEQRMHQIHQTLETGKTQIVEYRLRKDGKVHDYEGRAAVCGQDEVLLIVRDITERKHAEEQLRQTSSNLQAIFEAFPDLQFRLDADGTILDYHAGRSTELYIPPEQFLGQKVQDVLPTEAALQVQQAISQVMSTKALASVEYALPGPEGEMLFEARLLPLADDRIIAIVRNVTECKQAEESLRLSEEKLSKAFRSSPGSMTISTFKEGRYLEVNDTFQRLTGYTRKEVVGRTATELNIWVDPTDSLNMRKLLLEQGKVQNVEYHFRFKLGNIGVGLFSAELIDFEGEQCILAMTNDITDRKRAEAQLQAALERDRLLGEIALRIRRSLNLDQILHTTVTEIRQLLQADRVFIGLADRNSVGKVVAESVDYRYSSIMGWVADESYIKEVEIVLQRQNAIIINNISEIDVGSKRYEVFKQYQIQAALVVPILLGDILFGVLVAHQCSHPHHWEQHEIDLLEKLATQVAIAIQQAQLYEQVQLLNSNLERQVQERTMELQQKVEELQELSRLKDFFLHAVSHDLRTPIMGMLLVLKNLWQRGCKQSDGPTHHKAKHRKSYHSRNDAATNTGTTNSDTSIVEVPLSVLERMIQSSDRQLEMLNLLLDSHTMDIQRGILNPVPSSLYDLLSAEIGNLESILTKNQTTLVNLLSPDLPKVNADPMQIHRLFENLIVNAIKHNLPGLQLTISASRESNMLRCNLHHNGLGIEECDRLFELYVKGAHAKYSTGIGLGLYLCRQIVTAHGGQIGAIGEAANQGATFWFTLPVAE